MTHEHPPERLIDRYVDDDLDRAEREGLESHLAVCRACRVKADEYRSFFVALHELPAPQVPAGFAVRILDAVLPARVKERKVVRVFTQAYASVAVALSVVAAVALGMVGPGPSTALLAEGWSRSVGDSMAVLRGTILSGVHLVLAFLELAPLANIGKLFIRVLETVTLSLSAEHLALVLLSVSLAVLVLAWAMASARERGVPHASLCL
jgi:hypothetical protein